MRICLLALAACDMGMVPAPPAANNVIETGGHIYAVAQLVGAREECSNMGGEHASLVLDEPDARLVHAGGHGIRLGFDPNSFGFYSPEVGAYFVVELRDLATAPVEPIRDPGWCLNDMPSYYGNVTHILPALDRDDARKKLPEIAAHGMPKSTELHF